jgi:hypothetical protein
MERAKALKRPAGTGGKKRKDILFEKAAEEFLNWNRGNKRSGAVTFYMYCLQSLGRSFNGKKLGEIHPFMIEKQNRHGLRPVTEWRSTVN